MPVLFILAFFIVSIFSNSLPGWYLNGFINILNIDLNVLNQSFSLIDKFSIIFSTSLFIGSLGIVTAHELTHRKKINLICLLGIAFYPSLGIVILLLNMFMVIIKMFCLDTDPASAKRGENIYSFIFKSNIR